jgi:uncharacterized cupin superfamily protein
VTAAPFRSGSWARHFKLTECKSCSNGSVGLRAKLILTERNRTVQEFRPGDSLVLPVGYTGTWECTVTTGNSPW